MVGRTRLLRQIVTNSCKLSSIKVLLHRVEMSPSSLDDGLPAQEHGRLGGRGHTRLLRMAYPNNTRASKRSPHTPAILAGQTGKGLLFHLPDFRSSINVASISSLCKSSLISIIKSPERPHLNSDAGTIVGDEDRYGKRCLHKSTTNKLVRTPKRH